MWLQYSGFGIVETVITLNELNEYILYISVYIAPKKSEGNLK